MRTNATVKIKIAARSELVQTIKAYTTGLQYCVNIAWQERINNHVRLQPFVYTYLRKLGLHSQLVIACVKQACGLVKKAKSKPVIKRCSMKYNFPRSASFKNNVLSLATIKGRIKVPFKVPACYQQYFLPDWRVCESFLRMDNKGRMFFLFCVSKEVNAGICSQNIVGVDLGINNLAVASDGRFFHSSKVKKVKRRFKFLRSKLQAKGTRSAKRLLRKISGREKRFMADVNHCVSKHIVKDSNAGRIVLEELKGIRKTSRGKRMNYWISNWSFFQLQSFIQYKAERAGIVVKRVNPFMTSQLCHKCGTLGSRVAGSFACTHCGFSRFSADLNAARNLAHPMLAERQARVNVPNVTCHETPIFGLSIVTSQPASAIGS